MNCVGKCRDKEEIKLKIKLMVLMLVFAMILSACSAGDSKDELTKEDIAALKTVCEKASKMSDNIFEDDMLHIPMILAPIAENLDIEVENGQMLGIVSINYINPYKGTGYPVSSGGERIDSKPVEIGGYKIWSLYVGQRLHEELENGYVYDTNRYAAYEHNGKKYFVGTSHGTAPQFRIGSVNFVIFIDERMQVTFQLSVPKENGPLTDDDCNKIVDDFECISLAELKAMQP